MANPKKTTPAEENILVDDMMRRFRAHAAELRAQGACSVTTTFGPDIIFTVNYPEGEEPRTFH